MDSQSQLDSLETWASTLLAKLDPAARRAVMRDIARELRRSQQARIAAQRNPDGSAYEPRKPRLKSGTKKLRGKRGRIKRSAMFSKLRTTRYMRIEADANGLAIGFIGRVARIARVHQFGETDHVAPGGPEYRYPARELLGFTRDDRELIRDMLLKHISHD
ncbi:phage virion morphogenesis protein [Caballeronia sp. LZ001]|uniref:phage virion morphogenesis protein n=1 Tax=Caballeronia sp. LZ001 TaxID=3038553 RepID=UPI0028583209|nr:phage virion morphogenesis protein [Caballeronia sp. LZ001]MDR5800056.1 phage virion morphogenesis protein [Caballeronia sp. LZ001]MDR5801920.1 phage virion morphogenesis protein [Caballeronia sp. LZ001]MDR5805285.1 phage virion morphogenesis protein [Caballeronia sp. LZ001]